MAKIDFDKFVCKVMDILYHESYYQAESSFYNLFNKSLKDQGLQYNPETKEIESIEQPSEHELVEAVANEPVEQKPGWSKKIATIKRNAQKASDFLSEQKPVEWSEEIEIEIWEKAKKVFPDSGNMQSGFVSGYKEAINSLHPQPQSEWIEEDEKTLNEVIHRIEQLDHYWNRPTDNRLIEWLKFLRPQKHWKPSDEQLNNILDVLSFDNCTPKRRELLESLYKQLKKL